MLLRKRTAKTEAPSDAGGTLALALVEFSADWEQNLHNLSRLDLLIEHLYRDLPEKYPSFYPDVLVLPEFFSTGFTMNPDCAEFPDASPTLSWMTRTAGLYDCAVAGSVPMRLPDGERANRFYFVGQDGIIAQYDKRHLFLGGEDGNYTPGSQRVVFEYKGWRIMPGICFDLRFPVWMRNNPAEPYDLYLNVANWPSARKKVAEVLAEARAIENVCHVAFCNRSGKDVLLEYGGGSVVLNHRGRQKSADLDIDGTLVACASLDKAEMLRYRTSFPMLQSADEFFLQEPRPGAFLGGLRRRHE